MAYLLRALLILSVTLGMDASVAPMAAFYSATPHALLAVVTLQAAHIQAGEAQNLEATLNMAPGSQTIFSLLITYADGTNQEVVDATISNVATIGWQIPAVAPSGIATFHLATTGCGCADRALDQPAISPESSIDGWFIVD